MALDSRTKRLSMLNFTSGDLLPDPNVSSGQAERQTLLDLYSGILAAGGAVFKAAWARNVNSLIGGL